MDAPQVSRLRAALADRYTLERELGRGGMATVWLARDLKHDRAVAVKVLRPELAQALGPERFLREIQLTARLDHPHILPLLDSGQADGFLYYVMPRVEGESLRDRLQREKQLPLDEALQITREVADALSYAHRHDVVHRDVKPENILLAAGHARVADFGIARAITAAGGEKLTETGIAVGTPAYMSPEQALGEQVLDGRSDIYSLATMLYEMLAGAPPFTGPPQGVMARKSVDPVPPLRTVRDTVPETVEGAIMKGLARSPADRFTSGIQFVAALESHAATGLSPRPRSRRARLWRVTAVAAAGIGIGAAGILAWSAFRPRTSTPGPAGTRHWVLVADFMGTADPSLQHMAREIVATVFDQSTARRAMPPSMMRRGLELMLQPETTAVVGEVALDLARRGQVSHVVSGELNQAGAAFSVVLRVVESEAGTVMLAEQERAAREEDLIVAVERAAKRVRRGLGERRSIFDRERSIPEVMTGSAAAYRLFADALRGFVNGQLTNRQALDVHLQAVVLDPEFADSWRLIGAHYWNLGVSDSARMAVDRALALKNRLMGSSLLSARAWDAQLRGDWETTASIYSELVRRYAEGHNSLGVALEFLGHHRAAVEAYRQDGGVFGPSSLAIQNMIRVLRRYLGAVDEAAEWATQLSGRRRAQSDIDDALVRGQWQRAESLAVAIRNDRTLPNQEIALVTLASTRAIRGEVRAADTALAAAEAVRRMTGSSPVPCLYELVLYRLVSGRGGSSPLCAPNDGGWRDSSAVSLVLGAFHAALSGDTTTARSRLRRARARPVDERRHLGVGPPLVVEAWLGAIAGRWDTVTALLAGPARRWPAPSALGTWELAAFARWLVAEAYDRLDRPDSAAAFFALLASPQAMAEADLPRGAGLTYPFAHQRLVVLYSRMGRLADARRHWKIFSESFTNPDPQVRHLLDEARVALAEAERRSG